MEHLLSEIKSILGKPYKDLEFLLQCFSEVLIENNESELARQIPWISEKPPHFEKETTHKLLHLFSISFQLLNLAEVNGAVQNRRAKHEQKGLAGVNDFGEMCLPTSKKKELMMKPLQLNCNR
jgi:phosphoenolpyruvate carboxylase